MISDNIFEVSREEYKSFVETIKPETRDIREEIIDSRLKATKIYSKKTGKCLTSRVVDVRENDVRVPERYYIFELPDNDERLATIPKVKVVLETKEQVQAFLDGIKRMREMEEEKLNEGIVC